MANQQQKTHYLSYLIGAFIILLPFIKVSQETLIDFELIPKQLAIAILSIVVWIGLAKSSVDKPLLNLATGGFVLFLIGNILSLIAAINAIEVWAALAKNLMYGGLLFGFIAGIYTKRIDLNLIAKAGLIFGLIVGIPALFDAIEAYRSKNISDALYGITSMYLHKNYLASILLMALPFSLYEAIKNEKYFGWAGKIASLVILFDIVLLRTRSVWLALIFATLAVVVVFLIFSKDKESQKKWIRNLSIGAASFVLMILLIMNVTSLKESVFNQSTLKHRFTYWNSSWQMIKEQPITGVGAGNWKINFPKHGLETTDRSVINGTTTITRPHNDLIWILSEMGIIGFLGFVLFLKSTYWFGIKAFQKSEDDNEKWLILLSLFGLVSFVMYGFFEFPLERPGHYFLFILYASIAIASYLKYNDPKGSSINPKIGLPLFIIIGIFSSYVMTIRLDSAKSARSAVVSYPAQYRGMINSAQNGLSSFYSLDDYGNPLYFYEGVGKLGEKNIKGARLALTDALDSHPYHMLSLVQMGNTYLIENNIEQAHFYFDKTLEIASKNQSALIGKARAYLKSGDSESSLDMLNKVKPTRNGDYVKTVKETLTIIMNLDTQRFKKLKATLNGSKNKQELFDRYAQYRMRKSAERKNQMK